MVTWTAELSYSKYFCCPKSHWTLNWGTLSLCLGEYEVPWEYLFVTFSSINGHINLFNVYFYILVKIYCWFADIQLTAVHPWRELIWHTFSLHVITCAQGLQTAPQRCAGGILNNKITKTHRHAKQCGTEPTTEGHLFTLWGRKQWAVKLAPLQWETHTSGKPHLPSAEVCKWPWRHLEPWLGITSRSFS